MPLESATVIPQLDPDNPLGTDPISNGDNHVRLIKAVLVNQLGSLGTELLTVTAGQINTAAASAGQYATGTSTTSLLIGIGTKTFTTQTARGFGVGQRIKLTSQANIANYMEGVCSAYDTTTGAMSVDVDTIGGSGTFADWSIVVFLPDPEVSLKQRTITGADTCIASDRSKVLHYTATANSTLALTAAAALGDGFVCFLRNASNTDWTIDPSGAELICGQATIVIKPGFTGIMKCDGTGFDILWTKQRTYSLDRLFQVTSNTSETIGPDTYVRREYAVGAGSQGIGGVRSGASGGMAWGDIPVKPGDTLTRTFASGTVVVAVNGVAMLTGSPASGATAGTGTKNALVTNGGTNNGANATVAAGDLAGPSSGSPVGVGVSSTAGAGAGGTGWGGVGFAAGSGGGSGAAATLGGRGGRAVSASTPSAEPLLSLLTGTPGIAGASAGGDGGPGAGGAYPGGSGGIGAGAGMGVAPQGTAGFGGGGGNGAGATFSTPGCGGGGAVTGGGANGPAGVAGVLYFKELP